MTAESLLIVGASARAAADSAARAGFSPLAIDMFNDADLLERGPARLYPADPARLPAVAATFPDCPWIYAGSMENDPHLVDEMARDRPLYGNPGSVLRQIRDPFQLADALRAAGLPALDVQRCRFPPPAGRWLHKPLRSGGGKGISVAAAGPHPDRCQGYLQRFRRGLTCSAVYVGAAGRSTWIGATLQLSGAPWTGARGFQYAGSIGPLPLSRRYRQHFQRIGACLAARFRLRGLFGVDCQIAGGQVWPLEVNPRYTASIEVLEHAQATAILGCHLRACREGRLPARTRRRTRVYCGKAVVYAATDLHVTPERVAECTRIAGGRIADVPRSGNLIKTGQPLLTLLAVSPGFRQTHHELRHRARLIRQRLQRDPHDPDDLEPACSPDRG